MSRHCLSAAVHPVGLKELGFQAQASRKATPSTRRGPPDHALEVATGQQSALVVLVTLPAVLIAALVTLTALAALAALIALIAGAALVAGLAPLTLISAFFILTLLVSSGTVLAASLAPLAALAALPTFVAALTTLIACCHVSFLWISDSASCRAMKCNDWRCKPDCPVLPSRSLGARRPRRVSDAD